MSSDAKQPMDAVAQAMRDAVVLLQPVIGKFPPEPEVTRRVAEQVLEQTQSKTGLAPETYTVMGNMHSFSVRAPQAFIDVLTDAKQVAHVIIDEGAQSALIEPVRERSVKIP